MFDVEMSHITDRMLLAVYPTLDHIIEFIEALEQGFNVRIESNSYTDTFNLLYRIYNFEKETGIDLLDVKYIFDGKDDFIDVRLSENYNSHMKSIILLSEFK